MKMSSAAVAAFLSIIMLTGFPAVTQAEENFVTIGGGDFTGVYFPTGLAIAGMVNRARPVDGIRATVEATTGSPFNINTMTAGYLDFGLVQSDDQYNAYHGLAEWASHGPQTALRSVLSLYQESLTLVAAVDAGIDSLQALKGKRVSLGNPGPTRDRIVIDTLRAAGIDPDRDIVQVNTIAAEAPVLLQDNKIDAYFFAVGHPSETIRMALTNSRKARIIPIAGPAIDRMVAANPFYTKARLSLRQLYPQIEGQPEEVETFGVMATLCASAQVPDRVVLALTKIIVDNLDELKRQHPALAGLNRERMREGLSVPLHPGALQFYRERGLMK